MASGSRCPDCWAPIDEAGAQHHQNWHRDQAAQIARIRSLADAATAAAEMATRQAQEARADVARLRTAVPATEAAQTRQQQLQEPCGEELTVRLQRQGVELAGPCIKTEGHAGSHLADL